MHYLASPDGELYFALLSDWIDSATETAPGDDDLLAEATAGIARLNQRHGPGPAGPRFLLLHRRRVWDEAEGVWMGWERKRGKLHELNRLLRGVTDTTFVASDGHPPTVPEGVRYVITLDADTRLPRGAAKRMVGKMAHPLNAPLIRPGTRPCDRRSRSPAAANHGVAADRTRRLDFPARVLERRRNRSVRVRRLRRLPGSARRRLVQRQRDLRCGRVRGRAGGPRSRRHAAESRSFRRNFRALGIGLRHRTGRGVSVALRRCRRPAASMGPRRLAIVAVDSRASAWHRHRTRLHRSRAMADLRYRRSDAGK